MCPKQQARIQKCTIRGDDQFQLILQQSSSNLNPTKDVLDMNKRKIDETKEDYESTGISYAFKANTPSSQRTGFAKRVINNSVRASMAGEKISKLRHRLKDVRYVKDSEKKKFANAILLGDCKDKKIFFCPKRSEQENKFCHKGDSVTVSLIDNNAIEIIDTTEGLLYHDRERNVPICILLNRNDCLKDMDAKSFIEVLRKLEQSKPANRTVRGKKREVIYEDGTVGANYLTTGVAANMAGHGLYEKDVNETIKMQIEKMTRFIQNKCESYINTDVKTALRKVLDTFDLDTSKVQTLKKQKKEELDPQDDGFASKVGDTKETHVSYFPSMASGRNTSLRMHIDEDAFFSVVCIFRENDVIAKTKKKHKRRNSRRRTTRNRTFSSVKKNSDVLKYFTFSTGVSIALRTGDILLFNPQINHCISSNTDVCKDDDVFSTSFYFKSMVMGLNDNRIPFDLEER